MQHALNASRQFKHRAQRLCCGLHVAFSHELVRHSFGSARCDEEQALSTCTQSGLCGRRVDVIKFTPCARQERSHILHGVGFCTGQCTGRAFG